MGGFQPLRTSDPEAFDDEAFGGGGQDCAACDGLGLVPQYGHGEAPCDVCGGSGEVA